MTALSLVLAILIFLVAIGFLIKATTIVIHSLNHWSRSTKIELFVLTGLFSAVATSLPEIFVSISSALNGAPHLALGLMLGSNIVSTTLVIGTVVIVGGSLAVVANFVKKDIAIAFGATALPFLLLLDGTLSRLDGLLLLLAFAFYHWMAFSKSRKYRLSLSCIPFTKIGTWLHRECQLSTKRHMWWFILGVIMLLFSAEVVVKSSVWIASGLNLPVIIMGLLLVSLGTSLPELAFELRAAHFKQTSMIFGDLLGTLVVNSTLMPGIVALIAPITLSENMAELTISSSVFFVSLLILWFLIRTKYKLVRWEGALLVGIYVLFMFLEIRLLTVF